jgi:hypothetical protein
MSSKLITNDLVKLPVIKTHFRALKIIIYTFNKFTYHNVMKMHVASTSTLPEGGYLEYLTTNYNSFQVQEHYFYSVLRPWMTHDDYTAK